MDQRRASFKEATAALNTWLAEAEAHSDAALTDMTEQRKRLHDEMDCLLFDRSTFSVEYETTRRQVSAARTEIGTICKQLTERKMVKEEDEQRMTEAQYKLDAVRRNLRSFRAVNIVYRKFPTAF